MSELKCEACGSSKVIDSVSIADQGRVSDGSLKLVVHGDPRAILIKEPVDGKLVCTLCCECGDVKIRCSGNLEAIWKAYLKADKKTIEDIGDIQYEVATD